MKPSRLKKIAALVPKTEAEICDLLNRTAIAQLDMEQWIAQRDAMRAAALKEIERVHNFDARITLAELDLKRSVELVEAWADKNHEAFGKLKSLKKAGFTLGWRLGQWKTETATGTTWEAVTDYLSRLVAASENEAKSENPDLEIVNLGIQAAHFLRITKSCDRKAMLEHRENDTVADLFKCAGVEFAQDETFFLDPDREGQQPPTLVASS